MEENTIETTESYVADATEFEASDCYSDDTFVDATVLDDSDSDDTNHFGGIALLAGAAVTGLTALGAWIYDRKTGKISQAKTDAIVAVSDALDDVAESRIVKQHQINKAREDRIAASELEKNQKLAKKEEKKLRKARKIQGALPQDATASTEEESK